MQIYITKQGDTFDSIAYKILGNEYLFIDILQANYKYRNVIVFEAGVEIVIPDVEIDDEEGIPEWLEDSEEEEGDVDDDSDDNESW